MPKTSDNSTTNSSPNMPNPQLTPTKTKTATRIRVAVAFLGVAALLAAFANRFSQQIQTRTQFSGDEASRLAGATPTFCLRETSALLDAPRPLAQRLLGVQPAQATTHYISETVEVRTPAGTTCPAAVEVRNNRGGGVADTVTLPTGRGTVRHIPSDSQLSARCTSGAYAGFTGSSGVLRGGERIFVAGNNPALASGVVIVEFLNESGRHVDIDEIEVRRGSTVVMLGNAAGGEERFYLNVGTYEVTGTAFGASLRGTRTVESVAGRSSRYGIALTPFTPTATAEVPVEEPLVARVPGEQDCGSGTVRVIAGNICDRDNRILTNASGIINVSQRGQAVCHTNAVNGAFEVYDRSNGIYTLQFQNPGLGVFAREVRLNIEPQRVNFRTR